MFERFTKRAREVLVLAQEEARLLNHAYIGTEHLLLGLLAESEGLAAKALASLGISTEAVRQEIEKILGPGYCEPGGQVPFTRRAKKVLELSLREALQLGHNYIGTEHILLGLIREGEGVAAQVLLTLGADLGTVRHRVIELLSGYRGETKESSAPGRLTPAATTAQSTARDLAGTEPVASHHLLLGLIGEDEGLASRVLSSLGVTRERVEEQIANLDVSGSSDEVPEQAGARRTTLQVDGDRVAVILEEPDLAQRLRPLLDGSKGPGEEGSTLAGDDPDAKGFDRLWQRTHAAIIEVTRRMERGPDEPGGPPLT